MSTIRLLHISDLHVCKFLNIRQMSKISNVTDTLKHFTFAPTYSPGKLSRFLAFLRQRQETLDGVIITGDIATTGRNFDLDKAFTVVRNRIEPIGVNLRLLPGNHDRWTPYRKGHDSAVLSFGYDPGGTDFHSVFRRYWGPEDVSTFTIPKGNLTVTVISADFSLRFARDAETWKFVNKHGQGRVYGDILTALEKSTLDAMNNSETTTAVLWAVHFPPFCPDIGSDMRLINERSLLEKADELGVRIILAGHSHVANPYNAAPYETNVFCAGTLTEYNPSKNQFFIVSFEDLDGHYQVQLENYEYDRLRRRFIRT